MYQSFKDVMRIWPTRRALAAETGIKYPTVASMWRRDRISNEYFDVICEAAEKRGRSDVTFEKLARLAVQPKTSAAATAPI